MPPGILASPLFAALAGGAVGGLGTGIGAALESDAEKDAAKEAALGPIRGGTKRAGENNGLGPDMGTLEKIGQASVPIKSPVYGDPINPADLFSQKSFGTGFAPGNRQRFNSRRF